MFKNYLKTAFRNLARNKSYTLINVGGLTIGIAAALLIFFVIRFEASFDDFHPKKDHIYRVGSIFNSEEGVDYSSGVSFPVGPALRTDFPQIKEVASVYMRKDDQITVKIPGLAEPKKFADTRVFFAEPEFFSMFNFKWLAGNPATALSKPNTAVLSRETAAKFFGDPMAAIGKTIQRNNKDLYQVTGLLEDVPANSDFPLGVVVSYETLKYNSSKRNLDDWISVTGTACCFVVLPDEFPVDQFNAAMPAFAKKHKPADYAKDAYIAQPLSEIHTDERFGNFPQHTFSPSLGRALMLVAIFLVVIACVNFVNLATAQAVNRSKEVGVRKVLGSSRQRLMLQFICETLLISLISVLLAAMLAAAALPFLNQLLHLEMTLHPGDPALILFLIGLAAGVTILSGFYPAFVLSGFNPITALKNKAAMKTPGGLGLRRALVVTQFAVAHFLIIGTLIVVNQMDFFKTAEMGFKKTAILNVDIPGDSISRTKMDHLRNVFSSYPGIETVSFSYAGPSDIKSWQSDFVYNNSIDKKDVTANLKWADAEYFKTYDLSFVAGKPYPAGDTVREFVVNEMLLRKFGVTDPSLAIGKEINMWDGEKVGRISGVIKDFNSFSLKDEIVPVIMSTWKDVYQTINIRLRDAGDKSTLAFIEKQWNEAFPDSVYEYQFLDDKIESFYREETQLSKLYSIFAVIAIFISCLGLYGLVSFMAAQRTKEMGIRKVLGATARNIVYLLSKEFSLLILIAFAVAAPAAYFFMQKWLEDYTYRITPGVPVFLFAIAGSIIVAWLTVGYKAIKAAVANPVKSLRTE